MAFGMPVGLRRRAPLAVAWTLAWVALAACAAAGGGDPNLVACLVDTEHAVDDLDARPASRSPPPRHEPARSGSRRAASCATTAPESTSTWRSTPPAR